MCDVFYGFSLAPFPPPSLPPSLTLDAGLLFVFMKARYWLLTIPHADFTPFLPGSLVYIRGQLERGEQTGYLHWQLLAVFPSQQRLAAVKRIFGPTVHAEPSRSDAADAYVWKPDTRVDGTQFELGTKPFHRNEAKDWEAIRCAAMSGRLDQIPPDVFVQHYRSRLLLDPKTLVSHVREQQALHSH